MIIEYEDILLTHSKSIVNSRSECDATAKLGPFTFAAPVVAANMQSIINSDVCRLFDSNEWFYVYHRILGPEDVKEFLRYANSSRFRVKSISVGVKDEWVKFVEEIKQEGLHVDYFTVDVALSYNNNVIPICRAIREHYPEAFIILGNGSTGEWAQWVEENELADALKVGIGVSQACRTRQYTGYGSSTAGSLIECAKETNLPIISDGGITVKDGVVWIGDIAKALVLGADFVMSGALFSRCIDSPAQKTGYYGNASREAKQHSHHVEGELIKVESNGLYTVDMMKLVVDSLRSSISYAGGKNIRDLQLYGTYQVRGKSDADLDFLR